MTRKTKNGINAQHKTLHRCKLKHNQFQVKDI